MPVDIRVEGGEKIERFGKSLADARKVFADRLERTMTDFGHDVVYTAMRDYLSGPRPDRLDIVTGNLIRSVASKVSRQENITSAIVGTNVWYGKLHELGIGGMPARPFLRPAVEDNLKALEAELSALMESVIPSAA